MTSTIEKLEERVNECKRFIGQRSSADDKYWENCLHKAKVSLNAMNDIAADTWYKERNKSGKS